MEQNILPVSPTKDLQLTATIPQEMVESQSQLIAWADKKLAEIKASVTELIEAVDIATDRQWNTKALKNQLLKEKKSLTYYEKIRAALNEGYYIVPNFPVQLFAIRTKKESPQGSSTYWATDLRQDAQQLSIGEGDYKNPFPLVKSYTWKDGQGQEQTRRTATDWDDFDFPIAMAKPMIMEATSRAMALQIFDDIGIFPPTKKEDPVIIGRIHVKKNGYTDKTVSFMIAWHLNTNVI